jgi:hypothetical protein
VGVSGSEVEWKWSVRASSHIGISAISSKCSSKSGVELHIGIFTPCHVS